MAAPPTSPPVCLTVAGLDPSGGAGIAADLRAFARRRVYGACVITAVTVQNTTGVFAVRPLPAALIERQLEAVFADLAPAAVKVGMVANPAIVAAIARTLRRLPELPPVVVDPVVAASAGGALAKAGTVEALVDQLLPLAAVVTPNLGEARLLGAALHGPGARRWPPERLARALAALGPAVAITGLREGGEVLDLFYERGRALLLRAPAVEPASGHGSGCTYSAALAAGLAAGERRVAAARAAQRLAARAIANRLAVGRGEGPVDPFGIGR